LKFFNVSSTKLTQMLNFLDTFSMGVTTLKMDETNMQKVTNNNLTYSFSFYHLFDNIRIIFMVKINNS